jgi:hypothetical protein
MIDRNNLVSINFLKKEKFTGSMSGMRYQLKKVVEEQNTLLEVVIWPEPYAYLATPEEQKETKGFEFSVEGIQLAADWLNEQYIAQLDRWNSVNPYKS